MKIVYKLKIKNNANQIIEKETDITIVSWK